MDVRIPIFIALGSLLFSCGGNEQAVEKTEDTVELGPLTREEAQSLFILHCESCHGIDGKKKASEAADLSISKLSDQQIRVMILKGNDNGMMPYEEIITSERERVGLIEFVKSLRAK